MLINKNQTGYLKTEIKCLGENIRVLQDIPFSKQTCTNAFFLSVDFKKAFDSLNWNFLFEELKHVNF